MERPFSNDLSCRHGALQAASRDASAGDVGNRGNIQRCDLHRRHHLRHGDGSGGQIALDRCRLGLSQNGSIDRGRRTSHCCSRRRTEKLYSFRHERVSDVIRISLGYAVPYHFRRSRCLRIGTTSSGGANCSGDMIHSIKRSAISSCSALRSRSSRSSPVGSSLAFSRSPLI